MGWWLHEQGTCASHDNYNLTMHRLLIASLCNASSTQPLHLRGNLRAPHLDAACTQVEHVSDGAWADCSAVARATHGYQLCN